MIIPLLAVLLANKWILLSIVIPLCYWYATRNHSYWSGQGVPGPYPLPIVGSFFSLSVPISQLYTDYMKKYGKIFGMYQGQTAVLCVAEPEIIKRILVKDFYQFRNRTAFGQEPRTGENNSNLVDARDNVWKRVRSMVTPMFTTAKLKKMEPQMSSCTRDMMDQLEQFASKGDTIVAHNVMGKFTMDVIASCAFATQTTDQFVDNARRMLVFKLNQFLFSQVIPLWAYKLLSRIKKIPLFKFEGADFFGGLSYHLVATRKAQKEQGVKSPHDLLQLMIDAEYSEKELGVEEKEDLLEAHHVNYGNEEIEQQKSSFRNIIGTKYLTVEEMISNSLVFFIAGYETTASTLAFTLFELAVNPEVQAKLYAEIQEAKTKDPELSHQTLQGLPYLDAVLSETLRKYPPAFTAVNRECSAESYQIPEHNLSLRKGDVVLFPILAIHRSEEFHPDPMRYNPERFLPENRHLITPYTYLPFGGGPRNCVGMRFALKEAKLGLANIVDRFRVERTAKTPDQLELRLCSPVLKTEPIYLKINKR